MRVVYLIERAPAPRRRDNTPVALAISDWDGVHRGHVALARRCAQVAVERGGRAVAALPWPSPEGADNTPSARLTTLEERIARLSALDCFETLYITPAPTEPLEPTETLAWLGALGETCALLGEPQRSGAAKRLWPDGLAQAAQAAGLDVEQGPWLANTDDHSAAIRTLVEAGRMREATAALGYTYTVTGEVVGGDRRGRLLGFPTANVRSEPSKLAPGNGIYAAWVYLPGDEGRWPAVVSIGVRPTFGQGARRQVEAYLLDATMDLYGVRLRLEFVDWLRAELRFESVDALIAQMRADCERAHQTLQAEAPQGVAE
ncbi:MAG TPA: riboflavin kinase [Ktedonobacterales bacterium]|nr:riboflavin kinase [Ktedonobacterales bacterium]